MVDLLWLMVVNGYDNGLLVDQIRSTEFFRLALAAGRAPPDHRFVGKPGGVGVHPLERAKSSFSKPKHLTEEIHRGHRNVKWDSMGAILKIRSLKYMVGLWRIMVCVCDCTVVNAF